MTLLIVTERLVLRRYTHDDIPDLLELASQPSVAKEFSETVQVTEEGVRTYIDLQNSYQPFEKDKVFLTNRAQDCLKVLYQRSMWFVCPLPLPTHLCVSSGKTS